MATTDPVAYYQAVVQVFEDDTVNIFFDEIKDGDTIRLYEIANHDTLVDGLLVLAAEINAGRVLPVAEDYPVNLIDGMIVKHDGNLFARVRVGPDQSTWSRVDREGWAHPDEQIVAWIMADEATIEFDPAQES